MSVFSYMLNDLPTMCQWLDWIGLDWFDNLYMQSLEL